MSTSYLHHLRLSTEAFDTRPEVSDQEEGIRFSTHQDYFNGDFKIEARTSIYY